MNIILFYFVYYEELKGEVMNIFSRLLLIFMKNSFGACRFYYKVVIEFLFFYLTYRCIWSLYFMESLLF